MVSDQVDAAAGVFSAFAGGRLSRAEAELRLSGLSGVNWERVSDRDVELVAGLVASGTFTAEQGLAVLCRAAFD